MAKTTKKEVLKLTVESRKVVGRKVKKIRREGLVPANVYGKAIKSQSVQVVLREFWPVFQAAGETGLVELSLKGEEKTRPVLIHNVQLEPVSDKPLHVDFYQVNLKETLTARIPVELIGEAPAAVQSLGILIQPLLEVEVEALPTDLPEKFEIDVTSLSEVGATIKVSELKTPAGVKILSDPEDLLVKIDELAKEEVKPEPVVAEGEAEEVKPVEGEAKPVEGGAEPAGGETKAAAA
ncbi:MAG: 50S ribosomal protein L25 [Candidatus Shapirobacteria bacterium]